MFLRFFILFLSLGLITSFSLYGDEPEISPSEQTTNSNINESLLSQCQPLLNKLELAKKEWDIAKINVFHVQSDVAKVTVDSVGDMNDGKGFGTTDAENPLHDVYRVLNDAIDNELEAKENYERAIIDSFNSQCLKPIQ